ncbi:MAG: hypothetical protein ABIM89_07205, partial [Mycobacteriales bacterium]
VLSSSSHRLTVPLSSFAAGAVVAAALLAPPALLWPAPLATDEAALAAAGVLLPAAFGLSSEPQAAEAIIAAATVAQATRRRVSPAVRRLARGPLSWITRAIGLVNGLPFGDVCGFPGRTP